MFDRRREPGWDELFDSRDVCGEGDDHCRPGHSQRL